MEPFLSPVDKSIESEANGKYGEQVAWLTSGVAAIKSALNKQLTKYLESPSLENELTVRLVSYPPLSFTNASRFVYQELLINA